MHYKTLTAITTILLVGLVALLALFPSATFFMVASALAPLCIILLAVGVLRHPAPSNASESRLESDWYDQP